ncbi:hypothetical protein TcCL_ESM10488 [Trypanosoma cruzi]|nr:hypothetical protein TcCL_NonESM10916 [Trypanosoma cruzi]RNC52308.1 hypothetical protein TcCL_ESM10488 [Trypanosoma cruzi]
MRRGIPRNQNSFDLGGRKIRELFVVSKASCPRILTNREARWGSALAVFRAMDQSKIMVLSDSSVKLLEINTAISDQRLAVIHASQKTTRSFQSVRLRIT